MIDKININNHSADIMAYSTDESYIDSLGYGQKIKTDLKRYFETSEARLITDGDSTVYGGRDIVPQTGTWQLKSQYANKKYITLGTDDDNQGNALFYRMCRCYGFPYKMNVIAQRLDKPMGSDSSEVFTSAPSLFPDGVSCKDMALHIIANNTGEISQHGSNPLWDSRLLVDTALDDVYATYTAGGGTKTKQELKEALMDVAGAYDLAQGASSVASDKAIIEAGIDSFIYAAGIWGGQTKYVIDGITLDISACTSNEYPWRANNYKFAGNLIQRPFTNADPWNANRTYINANSLTNIDAITNGNIREMFIHKFSELTELEWKDLMDAIKQRVDNNVLEVVTGEQYYAMGEFV